MENGGSDEGLLSAAELQDRFGDGLERVTRADTLLVRRQLRQREVSTSRTYTQKDKWRPWSSLVKELLVEVRREAAVDGDAADSDAADGDATDGDAADGDAAGDGGDDLDVWTQCELCAKWRRLPEGSEAPDLTVAWTCSMNPDPQCASCEAAQEQWEEDAGEPMEDVAPLRALPCNIGESCGLLLGHDGPCGFPQFARRTRGGGR